MRPHRTVVVGGSLAGVHCARSLRLGGYEGLVTVLDADVDAAHDKPALSKGLLTGAQTRADVGLWSAGEPDRLGVAMSLGVRAVGLDPVRRLVRTVHGDVGYDALVIATGVTPVRPPVAGVDHARVRVLRTVADAEAVASALDAGGPLLVVGAGVIGMEVASSARGRGVDVVVVEPAGVPMLRIAGPEIGAGFAARARAAGVDLRTGVSVTAFAADPDGVTATLSDGSTVHAATVVLGVGACPAVGWLEGSGLPLADGIVCDASGRVEGFPGVFAAGDVAQVAGRRAEHWTSAAAQGRHVAAAVLADLSGSALVPAVADDYVWTEQFGVRLQLAGRMVGDVRIESGDVADGPFLATASDGERLVGVAAVGNVRNFLLRRRELAQAAAAVPA